MVAFLWGLFQRSFALKHSHHHGCPQSCHLAWDEDLHLPLPGKTHHGWEDRGGPWHWSQAAGPVTTTVARDVPWLCPSSAWPGQKSTSGDTCTGQGGWKSPTHVALPSTDAQVASGTFPAPEWFSKPSYGQHMHAGRWSCTPAKEISPGDLQKKNLIGSKAPTLQHPCSAFAPRPALPQRHQAKASVGWSGMRGTSVCQEAVSPCQLPDESL